jgi:hypothetical protein
MPLLNIFFDAEFKCSVIKAHSVMYIIFEQSNRRQKTTTKELVTPPGENRQNPLTETSFQYQS